MPKKRAVTFTAWSFSRLSDYERCELLAYFKYLDPKRPKFKPNKAMQRGTEIHTEAQHFVEGRIKKLPESLDRFEEEFLDLRKIRKHVKTEGELAVDKNWSPTDWFAPNTWLRVKMDAMYQLPKKPKHLVMIDYKTGKINPAHEAQLDLYATVGLSLKPHIKTIDAELWYLDWGEVVAKSYTRKDLPSLKKTWVKRSKRLLTDTKFAPSPGNHCTWCDFSAAKKGPCKF